MEIKPFETLEQVNTYLDNPKLKCLICGKSYKGLSSHVWQTHHMTADDYREAYGIPWSRGLQGTTTRELKSNLTKARVAENIEYYRANAAKAQKAASKSKKRKMPPAILKQKTDIISGNNQDKYMTKELFTAFLAELRAGTTKAEYCDREDTPTARKLTRYMVENPKEKARYVRMCLVQPFKWQSRNGTLNQYGTKKGRFALSVKASFERGEDDAEIAKTFKVSKNEVIYWTKQYREAAVKPLYELGMSDKAIGSKLGYKSAHVQNITRKWRNKPNSS